MYYKVLEILGTTKVLDSILDYLVFLHSFPSNQKLFFFFYWMGSFSDLDESGDKKKGISYTFYRLFDNF